jgi:hypothetical protein
MNFALILFLLTLATGVLWLLDVGIFRKRRRAVLAAEFAAAATEKSALLAAMKPRCSPKGLG